MSNGLDVFNLTDDEAMKLLVCESHVGTKTLDYQMENYVWKRRADGWIFISVTYYGMFKVLISLTFGSCGRNYCLLHEPLLPSKILLMLLSSLPWVSRKELF